MKSTHSRDTIAAFEVSQARFALSVADRLSEISHWVAPEIAERLRFAREGALQRARAIRAANAAVPSHVTNQGALVLGGWSPLLGFKLASLLPLIALIGGLLLIQHVQTEAQISATAEIDADLLTDDLPPGAYSDAGFVEFLKLPKDAD